MRRSTLCLVIGTIGLAAVGCGEQKKAGEHAEARTPGFEEEAHALERSAETGAAAQAAGAVEEGAEEAAKQVERQGVAATAKEVGKTLEGNVERSAKVSEETYHKERAAGENPVEASGEAYDAVLDEAHKKE